jgi:SAM-dependent methyltransferase
MSNRALKAMKQESFSIDEASQTQGIHQDRLHFDPRTCFLHLKDLKLELISLSCFDCMVLATEKQLHALKILVLAQPNLDTQLIYQNALIQTVDLNWLRSKTVSSTETGDLVLEFKVAVEPIKIERIKAMGISMQVIADQAKYARELAQLPAEFKNMVYELKDWLTQLKEKITKLETETPIDSLADAQAYRLTIAETVAGYLGHSIPAQYAAAPALMQKLSPEQIKWAIQFAREQVGHLVYGAPFANRAYYKPRGYAGDYEMMNHLYRNELVGKSLFDQCMHKYFIDEPAGAAVKNRGQYLFEKITELFTATQPEQALKILSVASGPAMEQQLFLKNSPQFYGRPVQFTCLDQDEESLKHAQRQLRSLDLSAKSGFDYQFTNMAIRNVIGRGLPEKDYDLIYSAGLFDYFTEQVARAAAVKMIASVKPGGRLIVGNFSKDNPSVPFMELVLDWHLIYRSEEDLLRIYQGLGSKIWVEKEPLGINLFVVIQK